MTGIATYRRQLGWLVLWALVPLPFLYIVLPPFWMITGAAGILLVLLPEKVFRPSKTLLNLLAVGIVVVVAMAGGLGIGPLRPLGHLLLLLTAVQILVVHDRRSFLRSLALVGMVWVVSVASSTHMMVALYFLVSAAIGWWIGIRLHLESLGIAVDDADGALPRGRHVLVAVGAALLIAVPFFLVMPRLGSPWIAGSSFSRSTGFSPSVDLSKLGRLTESREVALIMRATDGSEIHEAWSRLRGTAFDQVMAGSFLPRRADMVELEASRGVIWLRPDVRTLDQTVEIEIDLLNPRRYLMLPPGVVAVQADTRMALDVYGGVLFGYRREPLRYRVWVGAPRPPLSAPPGSRDTLLPRDHDAVRELAQSVAGSFETNEARAVAVERFLQDNYAYSLTSGVRIHTTDPVAWFLLDSREGHCEFFAGAMVVMLRHLGVPARMVAGYAGGDLSPDGDELVVREANAHAWVEVWLDADEGWVSFDPTPAAGVPGLGGVSGIERIRWTWQQIELFWDRKLLTFGFGDQVDLVDDLVEAYHRVARSIDRRALVVAGAAGLTVVTVLVLLWRLWRRGLRPWRQGSARSRGPASRAVNRLARALIPVGGVVPPWATVRSIGRQAGSFWPQSAPAVGELVERAEDELYGVNGDRDVDSAEIRRLWKTIRRGMKQRELTVSSQASHAGPQHRPSEPL
jgi:transglutaminase-like putative cysteine protease